MSYISSGSLQYAGAQTFVETFVDSTDYTSGTTTQLTLDGTPKTEDTMWIMFDGVMQHHTEYSVSGQVITFTTAIPIGTNAIEVQQNVEFISGILDNAVTAAKIQDGVVEYAKLAEDTKTAMGPRNAIINGNFDIWQRGTSFAAVTNGGFAADRFSYGKVGVAVHTASRSTDVPTYAESGIKSNYSLLLDVTTADTSIAAGDFYMVKYTIEGYDYTRTAGGDATLSFWVKGAKTGIHCIAFRNDGLDRTYVAEYTIDAADTWEKKTITIPLNETGGTWDYTNGNGLRISFVLAAGSTYQTTKDTWQAGGYIATSNQVNETDSTANNFHIAQVQFEKGDVATNFEWRSFGDALALCERYFEIGNSHQVGFSAVTGPTHSTSPTCQIKYRVLKRSSATATFVLSNATGGTIQLNNADGFELISITPSNTSIARVVSWTADAEL